ncbi:DNA-binding protein [Phyllobacterium phragmitis]|nr:DNA-binding protein [Phyllobacterium phragmitis]
MSDSLILTVSVAADEWAYNQRRVKYLETLLLHIVRDGSRIQEWFTAADLAAKALPGLPRTPEAISRRANKDSWRRRKARHKGKWFCAYHVSSLPARAFDELIVRILELPAIDAVVSILPNLPDVERVEEAQAENTAPPWVLPLVRILKTETNGDLAEAWDILPERLPPEIALPSVEEAAKVLVRLGLAN